MLERLGNELFVVRVLAVYRPHRNANRADLERDILVIGAYVHVCGRYVLHTLPNLGTLARLAEDRQRLGRYDRVQVGLSGVRVVDCGRGR